MSNPIRIKDLSRNKIVSSRFLDPLLSNSVQFNNKMIVVLELFKTVVATVC